MYGNEKRTQIISQTALFIALIAVGSYIIIPMVPVPFTLQTLFVLLCGCIMKRYAVIPAALYVILGTLGLPVFHQFTSGPGVLLGPTGGYLAGFIAAAAVVGLSYENNNAIIRISGLVLGSFSILLCGIIWISVSTGMTIMDALLIGALPFIPGDLIKVTIAFLTARRIEANYD